MLDCFIVFKADWWMTMNSFGLDLGLNIILNCLFLYLWLAFFVILEFSTTSFFSSLGLLNHLYGFHSALI